MKYVIGILKIIAMTVCAYFVGWTIGEKIGATIVDTFME